MKEEFWPLLKATGCIEHDWGIDPKDMDHGTIKGHTTRLQEFNK